MTVVDDEPMVSSPRVAAYEAFTPGEREDAITQLAAVLSFVQAELTDLVTAADRQGDWRLDGASDMVAWLIGHCRVSVATARAWVRTGVALDALPHLRAAFGAGELSVDQAHAAARLVTPEDDEERAVELPGWSVARIEREAALRNRLDGHARERARTRRFSWREHPDRGGFTYSGYLPDTEAALVNAALDRLAQSVGADPETGLWDPEESRRADALVDLARTRVATDPGPDPNLVVVHVPCEVVDGHVDGSGALGGIAVPHDSVLRLLCDTKIQFQVDGPNGTCVGIGREQRTIPRWLRRLVRHRDHTCRFPGCNRPIRHIHHVIPWCQGGSTDSWNLAGLCWAHHHLVHEGGWSLTGDANGELTFTSPFGKTLTGRPPPLRPEMKRHVAKMMRVHLGDAPATHTHDRAP